jgi:AraC-like DNA-binding protein
VFVVAPDLMGLTSWGRPDVDDVRELLRWCEVGTGAALPPHRFLVDIRALEGVEPATFIQFVDYVRRNGAALATQIVRQAQLRPDGLVGAIIGGFAHVARPPYPERVFLEPVEALDWLGIPADEGFALLGELEAIRSARVGRSDAVSRLHRLFETRGVLPIETAAQSLALSVRSLQRALRAAGTRYVTEARAFRIARAQDLLRTTDRPLGWIALELGFSSSQHFATEFRRAVGVTPSQWRTSILCEDSARVSSF